MWQLSRSSILSLLIFAVSAPLVRAAPPDIGQQAPDFALPTVTDKIVRLSELTSKGPVVLIVLRGYPGYQCPFCNRQAQDFLQRSRAFADVEAHVVMVYPGPAQDLKARAQEFMAGKAVPRNIDVLLDSGYEFTNLYGLRWEAPRETAYPSTFVIDRNGVVFFRKIAKEHGGRTTAAEILEALARHSTIPKTDDTRR